MPEEQEVTNEDVKKEFELLQNKADGTATEETSTEEKESAETTAEVEKTETAETAEKSEETTEENPVPYKRFKEVNDRKSELEDLAEQAKEFIIKDPVTGKLTIKRPDKQESQEQDLEDRGLILSEEEQLALDNVQLSVIKKVIAYETQQQQKQARVQQVYKEQTDNWWNKTVEDFPELKAPKFKDTPLYQRAVKILREQHVVWSPDKKTFYIPPNAQYLSTVQAEKELAREKVKTTQAKIEEKKNSKTNIFVEKKSNQQQAKKKVDEKEFETLSSSDQESALREQWEEQHADE